MTDVSADLQPGEPIVARAGSYYRRARYIMAVLLIAGGMWFGYDGWIGWPEENRKHAEISAQLEEATVAGDQERAAQLASELKEYSHHSDLDLALQKLLFFVLPVGGVGVLIWTLYNSRGEYRLEGRRLSVPGHPEIDLDQVTKIDKQLWDRKGIAYVEYDTGAQSGRLRLDDFVYDAKPTREIFKRIEEYTLARLAAVTSQAPADDVGTQA